MSDRTVILDHEQVQRKLRRIAHQLHEEHHAEKNIVIVGVAPRGATLAKRLATLLGTIAEFEVELVELRLDKDLPLEKPVQLGVEPKTLRNRTVVLVDDVLIVHVPNAFTPNGDGFNDTFEPVLVGADTDDFGFWIFDRWGEVVFEAREPGLVWNGAMKGTGDLLPDGVYAWRMIVRDAFSADRREYFGHVTLMK